VGTLTRRFSNLGGSLEGRKGFQSDFHLSNPRLSYCFVYTFSSTLPAPWS
jgi:hypothetical protein